MQAHLFGIMLVNNWNTFFASYQTIFGSVLQFYGVLSCTLRIFVEDTISTSFCRRWALLYFYAFYFFIVIITYSLLVCIQLSLPPFNHFITYRPKRFFPVLCTTSFLCIFEHLPLLGVLRDGCVFPPLQQKQPQRWF